MENPSFGDAVSALGVSDVDAVAEEILERQLGSVLSNVDYRGDEDAAYVVTDLDFVEGSSAYNDWIWSLPEQNESLESTGGILLSTGLFPTFGGGDDTSSFDHDSGGDQNIERAARTIFGTFVSTFDAASITFTIDVDDPDVYALGFDALFASEEFFDGSEGAVDDLAAIFVNGENVLGARDTGDFSSQLAPSAASGTVTNNNFFIDQSVFPEPPAGSYLVDNTSSDQDEFRQRDLDVSYNGVTGFRPVRAPLVQGENTVKIAIADTNDPFLDSGLFVTNFQLITFDDFETVPVEFIAFPDEGFFSNVGLTTSKERVDIPSIDDRPGGDETTVSVSGDILEIDGDVISGLTAADQVLITFDNIDDDLDAPSVVVGDVGLSIESLSDDSIRVYVDENFDGSDDAVFTLVDLAPGLDVVSLVQPSTGVVLLQFSNILFGTDDPDTFDGEFTSVRYIARAGDDTVDGSTEADLLQGDAGVDTLTGDTGGDFLEGGPGDDVIDGGVGIDTAIYTGLVSDYRYERDLANDRILISDIRSTPQDTESSSSVEFVERVEDFEFNRSETRTLILDDVVGQSQGQLFPETGDDLIIGRPGGNDIVFYDDLLETFDITYFPETRSFLINEVTVGNVVDGSDFVTDVERYKFNTPGGEVRYTVDELAAIVDPNTPPSPPNTGGPISVFENSADDAFLRRFTSTDPDGDPISYALTNASGAPTDNPFFKIEGDVLRVKDGDALDYEALVEDGDAVVQLYVIASDGQDQSAPTAFTVTVLNDPDDDPIIELNSPPSAPDTGDTISVFENSADDAFLRRFTSTDPDGDPISYALTNASGAPTDNPFFKIEGDVLRVKDGDALDYEALVEDGEAVVQLYAIASDGQDQSAPTAFTVTVLDVDESGPAPTTPAPIATLTTGGAVAENASSSATLATFAVSGATSAPTGYFLSNAAGAAISDARFAIVGDALRATGTGLDFETAASTTIQLFVAATYAGGTSTPTLVTLELADVAENVALGDGGETFRDFGVNELSITGGASRDVVRGLGGDDVIDGGGGNDDLFGNGGGDSLIGGDGEDRLRGGGNKDEIFGDGDGDELFGGGGDDDVFGGSGADTVRGGGGADTLQGGGGGDRLIGGEGVDELRGNRGEDTLSGGAENDTLIGGDDVDRLKGGRGDDTLIGDAAGGEGGWSDIFVFTRGGGVDTIVDFQSGEDRLKVDAFGFERFRDISDAATELANGDLRIDLDDDTAVVLANTALNEIDRDDFIF